MSAATAVGLAEQWLYQALSADPALAALVGARIYSAVAPEGAAYPLIVFAHLSAVDTTALGFGRVLTQLRYAVRAADRAASIAGLDAIARRVDQLLHGRTADLGGGALQLGSQRERSFVLGGQDAGVPTREMGQIYLIVIKEA